METLHPVDQHRLVGQAGTELPPLNHLKVLLGEEVHHSKMEACEWGGGGSGYVGIIICGHICVTVDCTQSGKTTLIPRHPRIVHCPCYYQ